MRAQPIALSSSKLLGLLQGYVTGDQVWPKAAAGWILEIEMDRCPPIIEADLVAAALRHGFVFDDADVRHTGAALICGPRQPIPRL